MSFIAGFVDSEYLWAVNDQDGGLYRISKKTFVPELMIEIKKTLKLGEPIFYHATGQGNKIYFFPQRLGEDIIIYSTDSNFVERVKLDISVNEDCTVLQIQGEVWFIPRWSRLPLIKYNILDNKVKRLDIWKKLFSTFHIHAVDACTAYEKIWLPVLGCSDLLELDIKEWKVTKHIIKGCKLRTIAFDGDNFWLSLADSPDLVSWNKKDNIQIVYKHYLEFENNIVNSIRYGSIICIERRVILLPDNSENIFTIDRKKKAIIKVKSLVSNYKIYFKHQYSHYWGYQVVNKDLWIFPARGSQLLIIDMDNLQVSGYELKISDLNLIYKRYLSNDMLLEIRESDYCTLQGFCLVIDSLIKKNEKYKLDEIGKQIYDYVKKLSANSSE